MTNSQIVAYDEITENQHNLNELLDFARADEREKMGMRVLSGIDLNEAFEAFLAKKIQDSISPKQKMEL